eukprot:snap_masked-scaffold_4-processed-gene-10.9-mRNA-1 protein AED:1.00 eAED:1.00 QI:0/-1/0/0/-1/1/1/0/122
MKSLNSFRIKAVLDHDCDPQSAIQEYLPKQKRHLEPARAKERKHSKARQNIFFHKKDLERGAVQYRSNVIKKEGLLKQKFSSELGVGRSDVKSVGVHDNFGGSFWYEKAKQEYIRKQRKSKN